LHTSRACDVLAMGACCAIMYGAATSRESSNAPRAAGRACTLATLERMLSRLKPPERGRLAISVQALFPLSFAAPM
jgi:hypothetical protein